MAARVLKALGGFGTSLWYYGAVYKWREDATGSGDGKWTVEKQKKIIEQEERDRIERKKKIQRAEREKEIERGEREKELDWAELEKETESA